MPIPFLEKTNHLHCVQIKSTGHPRQPPLGVGGFRPSAEYLITPPPAKPARPSGIWPPQRDAQARMPEPPKSPGRAGPQAPPCARTFRVGFAKSERTRTTTRARARGSPQACDRVRPHRGTPIWGHAGPTLWLPEVLGLGLPPLNRPGQRKSCWNSGRGTGLSLETTRDGEDARGHLQVWPPPPALNVRTSQGGCGDAQPTAGLVKLGALQLIRADTSTAKHSLMQTDTNTPAGNKRPPPRAALYRQLGTVPPSETGTWDSPPTPQRLSRQPSQPRV